MTKEQDDVKILNRACRIFGRKVGYTPYTGISIKEAFAYIGYPEKHINIKV